MELFLIAEEHPLWKLYLLYKSQQALYQELSGDALSVCRVALSDAELLSRLRAERFDVALVDNYPSFRCIYLIAHVLHLPVVAVGEATSPWEMRLPTLVAAFDVFQGPSSPIISGAPLPLPHTLPCDGSSKPLPTCQGTEPVQSAQEPQSPPSFLSRLSSLLQYVAYEWVLRAHLSPLPPDFQALTNVTPAEFALIGQTPELHLSLYDSLMLGVNLPQMPHVRYIGGITGSYKLYVYTIQ